MAFGRIVFYEEGSFELSAILVYRIDLERVSNRNLREVIVVELGWIGTLLFLYFVYIAKIPMCDMFNFAYTMQIF